MGTPQARVRVPSRVPGDPVTAGTAATITPLRPEYTAVRGCPGWAYQRSPGLICRVKQTDDDVQYTPVLDWCPLVLDRLVTMSEDGTPSGMYYRMTVGADTVIASHEEVTTGRIWARCPDSYGTATRTMRDVLASVISDQAAREPRTMAVTRTGWHATPDGGRMYVYPDGRTHPADAGAHLVGAPERLAMASAPGPAVTDQEIRAAVTEIAACGGWAPLFGMGEAARTLGQSLRPVPAALVIHGDPNAGKSCTGAAGRGLILDGAVWPPVVTARMSDTPTDLEMAVDFEADMPTLLDDLALNGTSSALDQRKANEQYERVIRPLGNQEAIRGRRNRDLTAQARRYVRSIATLTAQQLPAGMQASLFRRAVVLHLRTGDANVLWWASGERGQRGAIRSAPARRAIGDRIIARLGDQNDPAALLAETDAAGLRALRPHVDQTMPGWEASTDGMAGVVESAGAMLGGLVLIADAAGVEAGPLLDMVAGPLAELLAVQAGSMEDRREATDDLRTAIGDIIRQGLLNRRAHITDSAGEYGPDRGPDGLTIQEMGLRVAGRDMGLTVYEGSGVALFWLPDLGGLAVKSEALSDLVQASKDPRAAGHGRSNLQKELGRVGALVPSGQKGRAWSKQIERKGVPQGRYMVIRPEVIWPDQGPEEGPGDHAASAPAESGPPGTSDGPAPAPADPADSGLDGQEDEHVPAPDPVPVDQPTIPAVEWSGTVLAIGADVHGLMLIGADGARRITAAPDSLPAFLTLVLDHMPEGGSVAIDGELAARIGYPDKPQNAAPGKPGKPRKGPQECRAVQEGRAAGWKSPDAGIAAWTPWWGPDRPSVSVAVLPWIDHKVMRVGASALVTSTDDPVSAGYRLARYREMTGSPFTMNAGTSGVNMIRTQYLGRGPANSRRRRRAPLLKWHGEGSPAQSVQEDACVWERPAEQVSDAERAMPYVVTFDQRMAYLGAMGTARLALDALEPTGLPAGGFDRSVAGYWQVAETGQRFPLLPDLTNKSGNGPHWLTTPTVALLIDHGMPEEAVIDAWLPTGAAPATVEVLTGIRGAAYDRLRDALASIPADVTDPDELAVRAVLKATYREMVGMLRRGTPFVHRPDWSDTIIATSRTNLTRKLIAVGKRDNRWPLRIDTDSVSYAALTDDPVRELPNGWTLGDRVGQWSHKSTQTMTAFLGES